MQMERQWVTPTVAGEAGAATLILSDHISDDLAQATKAQKKNRKSLKRKSLKKNQKKRQLVAVHSSSLNSRAQSGVS